MNGDGETMAVGSRLSVGTRVRLRSASHLVELRSPFGEIVRPDEYVGYYVVRLDHPALYHRADGTERELPEIVEMADNMEALGEAGRFRLRLPDGRIIEGPMPNGPEAMITSRRRGIVKNAIHRARREWRRSET
jgi:hypothetical protein